MTLNFCPRPESLEINNEEIFIKAMAPRKNPQTGPIVTVIPTELSKLRTTAATRGSPGPMCAHGAHSGYSLEPRARISGPSGSERGKKASDNSPGV